MFPLTDADLRKSRLWQEIHEEGREEGVEQGKTFAQREFVRNCVAEGMSTKEIARLTKLSVAKVRRLAKQSDQS
jgi:predicted transposase/invertase (TIGR01784 family)